MPADSAPAAPRRILLIKPSSLGDIIHALPVLAALRDAYPQAHIAWLVSTGFAPLLEGHPLLNEVIPFDRRRFGRMLQNPRAMVEFLAFLRGLRRRRFDLVLDLQGLVRSGFLAWASGARRRIGPADARELAWMFYTRRVDAAAPGLHAVERNLAVAEALQLRVRSPRFPLGLRPEERAAADAKLAAASGGRDPRSFIAALPGARWASKLWPTEHWAALLDLLAADGEPPVVLLGGPDDRTRADAIRSGTRTAPIDLVGRTSLRELLALLARADRVVCQDSGPMHMAAALGRPLAAIFGPTDPVRTGPYAQEVRVVRRPLDCAPCQRRTCPLGHHRCMTELTPEQVRDALRALRVPAATPAGI